MSNAVEAELRLKFVDKGATSGMDRVARRVEQMTQQTENRVNQSNNRQRQSHERLSLAREALGMRSEQKIRREIQQTEAAYKRLAQSGRVSQDELSRAADKTRQKITKLTNEMGKLTAEQQKAAKAAQAFETAQGRIRGVAAGGAGLLAGGYMLKQPIVNAMSFEERLALEANTGYAEYDYKGKKAGEDAMRGAVVGAVKNGMTKDAALDALHELIAGNQVGGATGAIDLLPFVAKVSSGQGAAGTDVSNMLTTLMSSGFAKNLDQAKRMVEQGIGAGKAGQFEMPDMARYLPELLPGAQLAGLTGQAGYEKLLVWLQQARTKAGTSAEAANNVQNALAKLQSGDTAKDFKKAGRGDLSKMLMDKAAQGIDPATAWREVIQSEINKNPNLKPALAKLKSAKNVTDQDAAIESIKGLAGGQALGRYFQDMQAKSGMISLLDVDFGAKVADSIAKSLGAADKDFGYMETKSGFKVRRAGELKDLGEYAAADRLTPIIGDLADKFSDLSAKYPELAGGTTLATTGLTAVASTAGITAIALGGAGGTGLAGAVTVAAGGISKFSAALAAIAGWNIGKDFGDNTVKPWIDNQVRDLTGNKDATLGTAAYDLAQDAKNLVHVIIEPKDMGYVARVDKQKSKGVASTEVKGSTGNMWHGGTP